ncbi:MAG: YihY/virulence factor BrkB family protein [Longimicrobiales bacterium]
MPSLPARHRVKDFLWRVASRAGEDNILFMAGGIAFNLLIAVVPLVLLVVGLAGYALETLPGDPIDVVLPYVLEILPAVGGEVDLIQTVTDTEDSVVAGRAGLSLIGAVVFVWISARLVWTLRIVLREVFDVAQDRGLLRGFLFDVQIVVIGTVLILVNFGVTLVLTTVGNYGVSVLGIEQWDLTWARRTLGVLVSFASIWVLFLLIYRYLLVRRIPWRTALVAATFTGVLHEAMKAGFSVYATRLADFTSTFGNLATLAVLFIWIYYESLVFILGGVVAQVYTMNRVRRVRLRERFEPAEAEA